MIGKIVNGKLVFPPVNSGNRINVHKDPIWLKQHGFHELTSEELKNVVPPKREPMKFSKYKIIQELGEAWPTWKAKIVEAGAWDWWEACTYLSMDDDNFKMFWKQLSRDERVLLRTKCRY